MLTIWLPPNAANDELRMKFIFSYLPNLMFKTKQNYATILPCLKLFYEISQVAINFYRSVMPYLKLFL